MKFSSKSSCKLASLVLILSLCSCSTRSFSPRGLVFDQVKPREGVSKNGLPLSPSASSLAAYEKLTKADKHGYKTYPEKARTRVVRTTSYSHKENEKGAVGRKNCTGGILQYNSKVRSAAADWSVYPIGTKFRVAGLPQIFIIDDIGSALTNTNTIDIFHPSLSLMNKWGTRKAEITIIEYGDYERSLRLLKVRSRHKHCKRMYTNLQKRISNGELKLPVASR